MREVTATISVPDAATLRPPVAIVSVMDAVVLGLTTRMRMRMVKRASGGD